MPFQKGHTGYITEETRRKMSIAKKLNPPKNLYKKGQKRPDMLGMKNPAKNPEVGRRISVAKTGKARMDVRGEKCHFWKGGITPASVAIRGSIEYKIWRRQVFERDDYTCQICHNRGGNLHADHIKPFAYFPELRFELSNGRTLCVPCHRETDTYGYKAGYKNQLWNT